jgi:hypothetical protein
VALGDPGAPVICWANASGASDKHRKIADDDSKLAILIMTRLLQWPISQLLVQGKAASFRGLCIFGQTE